MGVGDMFLGIPKHLDLGSVLEMKIGEIVDRRLAGRNPSVSDGHRTILIRHRRFDVVDAVTEARRPAKDHEQVVSTRGRKYPQDYGVAFFSGWESYSDDEKVEAIRDAKKVLDRTLKRKKR